MTAPKNHRDRAEVMIDLADSAGIDFSGSNRPSASTIDLATRATGAAMTIAGAGLALGKLPRTAALALGVIQIPLSLANNPFWLHTGEERKKDIGGLLQSAGLIGGALIASTDRGGKPSVGWRISKRAGELSDSASKHVEEITAKVSNS